MNAPDLTALQTVLQRARGAMANIAAPAPHEDMEAEVALAACVVQARPARLFDGFDPADIADPDLRLIATVGLALFDLGYNLVVDAVMVAKGLLTLGWHANLGILAALEEHDAGPVLPSRRRVEIAARKRRAAVAAEYAAGLLRMANPDRDLALRVLERCADELLGDA